MSSSLDGGVLVDPFVFERVIQSGSSSRILAWEFDNIAQYRSERFEFSDSGIVVIKGRNSAGKSNIMRGLQAALTTSFVSNGRLRKLVRRGATDASVRIFFDDGVEIHYNIFLSSNKPGARLSNEYRVYALVDGVKREVFNTLVGGKRVRVTELPEPIARYLNLSDLGGSYLNIIRKSEKSTVLDQTPASMSTFLSRALGTEDIGLTLKAMKSDSKKDFERVRDLSLRGSLLSDDLVSRRHYADDVWVGVQSAHADLRVVSEAVPVSSRLSQECERLTGLPKPLPELELVDTNALSLVRSLSEVDLSVQPLDGVEIESLSTQSLSAVSDLVGALSTLDDQSRDLLPSGLGVVESPLDVVQGCLDLLETLDAQSRGLSRFDEQLETYRGEAQSCLGSLESVGGRVSRCTACGELSLMEEFTVDGLGVSSCSHSEEVVGG